MSAFGKIAEAQLIETNSKSQRIVCGSFLAASTWFRISENNLSYVILVFLGNKPKVQGIVLLLILAWMVYNWKNICGQTLKVPSQYHSPSLICTNYQNSIVVAMAPAKSKHNFQFSDSWYSRGNTGISALISGLRDWCVLFFWCLIVLPEFSFRGRFAMVAVDIFANSLAMMFVSLILLSTLVNSTLTCQMDECAHLIALLHYRLNQA